ncbi:hypothetical protein ABJI51_10110 [Amycolatopsis sp. NEAU-NG30]|uniref:Uncharacterized protein n=1 Tax=Amycolatopsis melonis TaxID=3156488 RepID=A0ABV0LAU5_9PSEU
MSSFLVAAGQLSVPALLIILVLGVVLPLAFIVVVFWLAVRYRRPLHAKLPFVTLTSPVPAEEPQEEAERIAA